MEWACAGKGVMAGQRGGAVDGTQGAGVAWHREEQSRVSWSREGCIPGPAPRNGPRTFTASSPFPASGFLLGPVEESSR